MIESAETTKPEQSVELLALIESLLKTGDHDAVLDLIKKLLKSHEQELRDAVKARKHGGKNEGVSSEQLAFLFAKLEEAVNARAKDADKQLKNTNTNEASTEAKEAKAPRTQPPRRRPIPAELPVVPNEIAVPAAERPCPVCGKERVCIGHDVTRVIDIIPAKAIVREDRREKLACKTCETEVVRAPNGDKVVDGGAYGSNLVADMMVSKYDDSLPLERQRQRYERLGLKIPSASMGDQVAWAADLLKPVARRLFEMMLDADIMHLDATGIPVLDRDHQDGIKSGALWGYVGVSHGVDGQPALVASYLYNTTAKKNGQKLDELGPEEVLAMRKMRKKPHVCADASGLFDASFVNTGLIELGCNMHARRYFQKALDGGDLRAALPIGGFKKIYDIEEEIRGKPPDERAHARNVRSREVYDKLVYWCETYRAMEPPKSLLGQAVRYLMNHKEALMRFLDDERFPIDNGIVERLHRRPAVGRRNYLFAGSDTGAERAAIAYSVLGTCRLLGINALAYLSDVLPRLARGISIARDLPALMPAEWQALRST